MDGSDLDQYQTVLSNILSHQHVFFSAEDSPHAVLVPQKTEPQTLAEHTTSKNSKRGLITIASLSLHPTLETSLHLLNADLFSAHFLVRHAEQAPQWEMMYLHGVLHRIEGDVDNARAWYGDVDGSDVLRFVWRSSSNDADDNEEEKDEAGISGTEETQDNKGNGWKTFLNRVERWRDATRSRSGVSKVQPQHQVTGSDDELRLNISTNTNTIGETLDWQKEASSLRSTSLWELKRILAFCENKYGTAQFADATPVWVSDSGANHSADGNKNEADKSDDGNDGKSKADKKNAMIVGGEGWRQF